MGQARGWIYPSRRRSDKFGPDYAAVTFIFIEILHPNDQPYFSIGRDFVSSSFLSTIRVRARAVPAIPTQILWIDIRSSGRGGGGGRRSRVKEIRVKGEIGWTGKLGRGRGEVWEEEDGKKL